jgi:hypothetical protein
LQLRSKAAHCIFFCSRSKLAGRAGEAVVPLLFLPTGYRDRTNNDFICYVKSGKCNRPPYCKYWDNLFYLMQTVPVYLKLILENKVIDQMYIRAENLELEGYLLDAIKEISETHKAAIEESAEPPTFLLEEVRPPRIND